MTREETRQAIEVMLHFNNGGEVEVYYEDGNGWEKENYPNWNWEYNVYRIAKPEPVSIPITEEEKCFIEGQPKVFMKRKWLKDILHCSTLIVKSLDIENFYFLNPSTQCWEEWSEELERELLK